MKDLHQKLLGAMIKDTRGSVYEIVAIWIEVNNNGADRIKTLVMKEDGVLFVQYLPDTSIEVVDLPS